MLDLLVYPLALVALADVFLFKGTIGVAVSAFLSGTLHIAR